MASQTEVGNKYTGIGGRQYQMGKEIKHGGEGWVYEVSGRPDIVAKVFLDKRFRPGKYDSDRRATMRAKLGVMLDRPISSKDFAWPQDILQDGNGNLVGYVMPKVSGASLFDAEQPLLRETAFPNHTYRSSIILAYNLALMVEQAHNAGYIIGDLNPGNILVTQNCHETIIDTDSFHVHDPRSNKVYKCEVVYPEFVAPEHDGYNMENPRNNHTEHSDDFILAIHVFILLCEGQHPFSCIMPQTAQASGSTATTNGKIDKGRCPFVTNVQSDIKPPVGAIDVKSLPAYIRELIDRAFTYTERTATQNATITSRPTAHEWRVALKRFLDDLDANGVTCSNNHQHMYLKGYGHCPFCAATKAHTPVVNDPDDLYDLYEFMDDDLYQDSSSSHSNPTPNPQPASPQRSYQAHRTSVSGEDVVTSLFFVLNGLVIPIALVRILFGDMTGYFTIGMPLRITTARILIGIVAVIIGLCEATEFNPLNGFIKNTILCTIVTVICTVLVMLFIALILFIWAHIGTPLRVGLVIVVILILLFGRS